MNVVKAWLTAFLFVSGIAQAGVVYNWTTTSSTTGALTAQIEFTEQAWRSGSVAYNYNCSVFTGCPSVAASPVVQFSFRVAANARPPGFGAFDTRNPANPIQGSTLFNFSFVQNEAVSWNIDWSTFRGAQNSVLIAGLGGTGTFTEFGENCRFSGNEPCSRGTGFWKIDESTIPGRVPEGPSLALLLGGLGVLLAASRKFSTKASAFPTNG
jgi:hypothetical protein